MGRLISRAVEVFCLSIDLPKSVLYLMVIQKPKKMTELLESQTDFIWTKFNSIGNQILQFLLLKISLTTKLSLIMINYLISVLWANNSSAKSIFKKFRKLFNVSEKDSLKYICSSISKRPTASQYYMSNLVLDYRVLHCQTLYSLTRSNKKQIYHGSSWHTNK